MRARFLTGLALIAFVLSIGGCKDASDTGGGKADVKKEDPKSGKQPTKGDESKKADESKKGDDSKKADTGPEVLAPPKEKKVDDNSKEDGPALPIPEPKKTGAAPK
jgi:hypothetical protein